MNEPFSINSNSSVISAPGAGNYIYITGILMHNNENTATNDEIVKLTDGNGGTVLYGGATGALYLPGQGGPWGRPRSETHPWWKLSENTPFYINPTIGQDIGGIVYYRIGTNETLTILHAPFDVTANTEIISATADKKIKICSYSFHNNDPDISEIDVAHITDGNGGTDLYGGVNGAFYLPGQGGVSAYPGEMKDTNFLFECSTNTPFYLNPTNGKRISGAFWYKKE